MRPSSSNIFHTSLAFHPSSLTARRRMCVGTSGVGGQWSNTTGSRYEMRSMDSSSRGVVSTALAVVHVISQDEQGDLRDSTYTHHGYQMT
jgi:hypothetical protein